MNFTQWLNQNPWLNVVFLLLAIASIIISIYLYVKSKREKVPYYHIRTYPLIEDKLNTIKAVEILYQGQKIDNLTISKVAIWNRGKDTINATDVAPKDPLRITIDPKYRLLSAEIIRTTTEVNNFSITFDLKERDIKINFDYFHTNEGVVIHIYHTGKSNDDLKLQGTIKGVPRIILFSSKKNYITDSVVNTLLGPLPEPEVVKPVVLKAIYIGILFAIIIAIIVPIAIPLFLIDTLMTPWRRTPREFELID